MKASPSMQSVQRSPSSHGFQDWQRRSRTQAFSVIPGCLRTVLDFWNAPGRFRWPLFALALAGALASAAMLSPHLRIDAEPTLPPPPSQIEVIVAKQSLNPGDVLSKDNLAVGKVQKDFYDEAMLSPDRFSDIDGLVMMQTLAPGQALWTTHLAKPEHRHPSLGLRRIQLVLDDRYGFKQLPLPGDFVDFYWQASQNQLSSLHPPDLHSYLVEDVRLVSIKRSAEPLTQNSSRRQDRGPWIHIEVEVLPEQALKLLRASAQGALQMVLRNPNDRSLGSPQTKHSSPEKNSIYPGPAQSHPLKAAADRAKVRDQPAPVASVQLQSPVRVEVIRGGQRMLEPIQSLHKDPNVTTAQNGLAQERANVLASDRSRLSTQSGGDLNQEVIDALRRLAKPAGTEAGVLE